jgi:hypothetical protein
VGVHMVEAAGAGADVLPGLRLPLTELWGALGPRGG